MVFLTSLINSVKRVPSIKFRKGGNLVSPGGSAAQTPAAAGSSGAPVVIILQSFYPKNAISMNRYIF